MICNKEVFRDTEKCALAQNTKQSIEYTVIFAFPLILSKKPYKYSIFKLDKKITHIQHQEKQTPQKTSDHQKPSVWIHL